MSAEPEALSGPEATVWAVTHFGCNSSHNDMWLPKTTLFRDKEQAYVHFETLLATLTQGKVQLRIPGRPLPTGSPVDSESESDSDDGGDSKPWESQLIKNASGEVVGLYIIQDGEHFKRPEGALVRPIVVA